jgi:hypothetical protein
VKATFSPAASTRALAGPMGLDQVPQVAGMSMRFVDCTSPSGAIQTHDCHSFAPSAVRYRREARMRPRSSAEAA